MKVVEHPHDPVFVGRAGNDFTRVELRIGEAEPGRARYAVLNAVEARRLAIALLEQAERVTESPVPKANE